MPDVTAGYERLSDLNAFFREFPNITCLKRYISINHVILPYVIACYGKQKYIEINSKPL